MVSVVISIGANCGDRSALVSHAISWLESILTQTKCSDIYETPCALQQGSPYLNAVIEGFYQGTGIQLEEMLKDKEFEMGRSQHCREKGEVPIDLDIVILNGDIAKTWDYRQKFFQIGYSQINRSPN